MAQTFDNGARKTEVLLNQVILYALIGPTTIFNYNIKLSVN